MPESKGQLTIRTNGGADELVQLLQWFNGEDELRGRVRLPQNQIRPGEMGNIYDVLVVAVGAGGIAPALASSLTTWLSNRRSDITVTLRRDDNTEITVDAKRVRTPEIAEALRRMLEPPSNLQ
ncbi:effector-associated constant component EACC1 [Nocardia vulneris]|uniref:Oxidoreductase n=1 Tax=Nocardia vulneris TaxID=1141657 RepID=A0ABR4Z7Q1_9NOCA|nr:hypothetical protein [Nocardia vulneris]KIA61331.1 hypothetical protein FG87_31715 [Nocardia vulneris]